MSEPAVTASLLWRCVHAGDVDAIYADNGYSVMAVAAVQAGADVDVDFEVHYGADDVIAPVRARFAFTTKTIVMTAGTIARTYPALDEHPATLLRRVIGADTDHGIFTEAVARHRATRS